MKTSITFLFFLALLFYACEFNNYPQGERLYISQCAGCHGEDGKGFKDLYPPVADADYFQKDPYEVVCIIVNGLEGEILVNGKNYDQPMQAIENLSPVQITNILNYVASSWNPSVAVPINVELVKEKLISCEKSTKVY